jgi:acyl-CoA reductase-like NAD-dependent aldehyde dehydrogenase
MTSHAITADHHTVSLPQRVPHPATCPRDLEAAAVRLRDAAPRFAGLDLPHRLALVRSMQAGYARIGERSVAAACSAKHISPGSALAGEEWTTGPWCVIRHLRLLAESLEGLRRNGRTPIGPVGRTADGRLSVRVFPANRIDGVLFAGTFAEVYLEPGVDETGMDSERARFYRAPHSGRVVLVLGAGNINAIPVMDVLSKMFNEGKVCLLKMHPVNSYLGPLIEEAFSEAVAQGFLAVVYGGADEGAFLARHAAVDEVHLTGSAATYDHLMWGPPGSDREGRKARNEPLFLKPVTAELGNVSPVLIVPGPYRDRELAFQAESIAGAAMHNAGFNCNAARVLLTPRAWDRRTTLLDGLRRIFTDAPAREAYYPGAEERWRQLTRGREGLWVAGAAPEGALPWTLVPGLDPADPAEPLFATEPFCSILSEASIGSPDPIEYLERAVTFANNRLWGTLSVTVVVHPATLKDPTLAGAVERAIGRLRYGAVAVNTWTGLTFAFGTPPWGAHPGSTPQDIQSGVGFVHNTPMLEGIEKVVLRQPLTSRPKPVFFPSHQTAHVLSRRLTGLDERASWSKVPGVVAAAMRG